MKKDFRRQLLIESSTSDGATLYLVLMPLSSHATLDDIFVEIRNEMHLFDIIRGTADQRDLANTKVFVNKTAAMRLAQHRIDQAGSDYDLPPPDDADQIQ